MIFKYRVVQCVGLLVFSLLAGCTSTSVYSLFNGLDANRNGGYYLTINGPENARVRVLNIRPKYKDNMLLKPGSYHIEVSKSGYQTYKKWITLKKDLSLNIDLIQGASKQSRKNLYKLSISGPDNSRIRILNIIPKYKENIILNEGRYHIEVSKAGFEMYREWIYLGEDKSVVVKLKHQEEFSPSVKALSKKTTRDNNTVELTIANEESEDKSHVDGTTNNLHVSESNTTDPLVHTIKKEKTLDGNNIEVTQNTEPSDKKPRATLNTNNLNAGDSTTTGHTATGSTLPPPSTLSIPRALMDNSGLYFCPFTQDAVMAEWTDNAVNAQIAATIGKTAGALAGQWAFKHAPLIGGIAGSYIGLEVGQSFALEAAGGMEFIKESSDISFNMIDDLAVYTYVKFSSLEHYPQALDALLEVYPNLQNGRYEKAIMNAPRY